MLKEVFLNHRTWVVISVIFFSVFCLLEGDYTAPWFVVAHYVLLAAVYVSILIYAVKKITAARRARAGIFLKGVRYGNGNPD